MEHLSRARKGFLLTSAQEYDTPPESFKSRIRLAMDQFCSTVTGGGAAVWNRWSHAGGISIFDCHISSRQLPYQQKSFRRSRVILATGAGSCRLAISIDQSAKRYRDSHSHAFCSVSQPYVFTCVVHVGFWMRLLDTCHSVIEFGHRAARISRFINNSPARQIIPLH